MSIFGSILDKIFHHSSAATTAQPTPPAQQPAAKTQQSAAAPTQQLQSVDVEAVLTKLASTKGGGNWKTSIVDLLKLLDLDSSLSARKELATELDVPGEDGSAEKNMALHKAVMQKLAENGGKVPASMKD